MKASVSRKKWVGAMDIATAGLSGCRMFKS